MYVKYILYIHVCIIMHKINIQIYTYLIVNILTMISDSFLNYCSAMRRGRFENYTRLWRYLYVHFNPLDIHRQACTRAYMF